MPNPIQVDKDIYYAWKYWNEKFKDDDFKIGGTLVYLNKLHKNVKGFEHWAYEWNGKFLNLLIEISKHIRVNFVSTIYKFLNFTAKYQTKSKFITY